MSSTCACTSDKKKLFITLQAVILFIVFSSPMTYKIMRSVLGPVISTFEGLPHPTGILLHATLFGIVTYLLMKYEKTISKFDTKTSMKKMVGGYAENDY